MSKTELAEYNRLYRLYGYSSMRKIASQLKVKITELPKVSLSLAH